MGFNGGNSGSITNHKHTNIAGDGGSLDTTSLYNNVAFPFLKTLTKNRVVLGADFTMTSATLADVTGMTITVGNVAGGIIDLAFFINYKGSAISTGMTGFTIVDNAVAQEKHAVDTEVTGKFQQSCVPYTTTLAGQVVKLQAGSDGVTTLTVLGSAGTAQSTIEEIEVSK